MMVFIGRRIHALHLVFMFPEIFPIWTSFSVFPWVPRPCYFCRLQSSYFVKCFNLWLSDASEWLGSDYASLAEMSQKQCWTVLVVFYQVAHDFDILLQIFILSTWLRWCLWGMFIPFPLNLFLFYLYTCLLIYVGMNSWIPVTIKWVKNLLLLQPVLMLKLSPICPTETPVRWYPFDPPSRTQKCFSLFCNISIPSLEPAISARTTGYFNWKIKIGD